MAKPLTKRAQISKANSTIMLIVSIAIVITVFSLVSTRTLLSQASYNRRLVNARHQTVSQLQANENATTNLLNQYNNVFENSDPANIIGGKNDSSASAVPPDGDNARIVLDALPTSYDFPGLISSIAKIMASDGISNPSISGTDQTATADNKPSSDPQPTPIKVTVSGQGSYDAVQQLIKDLERSIRPFDVTSIQLNGTNSSMSVSLDLTTYYQVSKNLETGTKKIK